MEHEEQNLNAAEDMQTAESGAESTALEGAVERATESTTPAQVNEPASEPLESLLNGLAEEAKQKAESEPSPESTAKECPRGPDGRFMVKAVAEDMSEPQAESEGQETPAHPSTEEAEEAEWLEGVKEGPRRERLKQVFAQRKEAQNGLNEIREMVGASGMTPEDFAQMLEFGRLIGANDAASRHTALAMVDQVRANLCKQLGVDAPGVELLADFPDLSQAVQNQELSRERALEMAHLRRQNQTAQYTQHDEAAQRQEQAQFERSLVAGQQAMADYLSRRAAEADHPQRMKAVQAYFAQPDKVQQFVSTYQPHQWASAMQLLYDAVRVATSAQATASQPLRAKPAPVGTPVPAPNLPPAEQLNQQFRAIGI